MVFRAIFLKAGIMGALLLGLPLFGIVLAGMPVGQYLEFPPETRYVRHAPFSWLAFFCYTLFILAVTVPLTLKGLRALKRSRTGSDVSWPFPWWGWLSILLGLIAWVLAWTRFSWFARLQPYTFFPLWFSFIVFINSLNYRRYRHCIMLDRPKFFFLLFPLSSVFWWFFEYLNRFVQNWHYVGVHFSCWEYFWNATLCFSTVLPAVISMREFILGLPGFDEEFRYVIRLSFHRPRGLAWIAIILACLSLTLIGLYPDFLFPLLWISPLLIIVSLQILIGDKHVLQDVVKGDWRLVVSSALAALCCGWFWEMWNFYSFARWEYAVPFVHRFEVFKMPVLGFAGYLPFGLECAVVSDMLDSSVR